MPQIVNKYEGNLVATSYVFGEATHDLVITSTASKSQEGYPVVRIEYKISTYRLHAGDNHPSLFSTDGDKMVSSFQGTYTGEFTVITSTKPGYLETIMEAPLNDSAILTSVFQRPEVALVISNDGTTNPSEMAPILASIHAIAIDPETLDDTEDL